MALAQPKSALPAAQQRRRQLAESKLAAGAATEASAAEEAAKTAEAEAAKAAEALTAAEAANADGADGDDGGETVTLTRSQLNELQGASDRSARADRDARIARMEAEEAKAALTAAGTSRKEHTHTDEPLDLGFTEADTALQPDEEERFGESKAFVLKIVRAECARLFKAYDARVSPRIAEARTAAAEATTRITRTAQKGFTSRVREKVADVDKLVSHANFKDFLEAAVPMTSLTYNEALNQAHADENLQDAVDIFNAFRTKYGVKKPTASGYNGAAPSGATSATEAPKKTTHTMAERSKKSEDYRKGRISKDEFDKYKVTFDAAMEAGQVGD